MAHRWHAGAYIPPGDAWAFAQIGAGAAETTLRSLQLTLWGTEQWDDAAAYLCNGLNCLRQLESTFFWKECCDQCLALDVGGNHISARGVLMVARVCAELSNLSHLSLGLQGLLLGHAGATGRPRAAASRRRPGFRPHCRACRSCRICAGSVCVWRIVRSVTAASRTLSASPTGTPHWRRWISTSVTTPYGTAAQLCCHCGWQGSLRTCVTWRCVST